LFGFPNDVSALWRDGASGGGRRCNSFPNATTDRIVIKRFLSKFPGWFGNPNAHEKPFGAANGGKKVASFIHPI